MIALVNIAASLTLPFWFTCVGDVCHDIYRF